MIMQTYNLVRLLLCFKISDDLSGASDISELKSCSTIIFGCFLVPHWMGIPMTKAMVFPILRFGFVD